MRIALTVLLSTCMMGCLTKVEPTLPEATQVGKNTLGCLIDNQLWLPKKATSIIGSPPVVYALYSRSTNELKIGGRRFGSGGSEFTLKAIAYGQGKATLLVDNINPENETYYYDDNESYIPLTTTSSLTITKLDTINRIVSGSFTLEVIGQRTKKQVNITKGIFDIQLEFYR